MQLSRLRLILKALVQLGARQTALYARYKLALHLGLLRAASDEDPDRDLLDACFAIAPPFSMPDREQLLETIKQDGLNEAVFEAEEILAGRVRLFGAGPVPLGLELELPLYHWTAYETGAAQIPADDIKLIWEPARFGWAVALGRAYHMTGDERCVSACLQYFDTFLQANPPYLGPNWISAQEAAIRILGMAFAAAVFQPSPELTKQHRTLLGRAIASHAHRIPTSLSYARAQNNNHLLVEALGLLTAGVFLPEHPQAGRWRVDGLKWFLQALDRQIAPNGAYVQHSSNYHRLMLQAALWGWMLIQAEGESMPQPIRAKLAAATNWLLALVDHHSGSVPNLGPNDGAYILPLSGGGFYDYRPVLQAAGCAFLGHPVFPPGAWNEMPLWFGCSVDPKLLQSNHHAPQVVIHHPELDGHAYLRVAQFDSRPGHADQLHLDLWHAGRNLTLDAGTYSYNASPPWQNALTGTDVHNTLTIDGRDQMTRAGRFLWLDWAQAEVLLSETVPESGMQRVIARHTGYLRGGMIHRRAVETLHSGWLVEDLVVAVDSEARKAAHFVRLHLLLPDYAWELLEEDGDNIFLLDAPSGPLRLRLGFSKSFHEQGPEIEEASLSLVRAGEMLIGSSTAPAQRGWFSPTYAHKVPALSIAFSVRGRLPLAVRSEWIFEA